MNTRELHALAEEVLWEREERGASRGDCGCRPRLIQPRFGPSSALASCV
ncbi:MAG TPA: hypothetical protein VGX03_14235 [Candidatus Binatia bacterium]|jgi:hypothetical protein|nr:hypothetical protein [Candidatus Binatia bacterium]